MKTKRTIKKRDFGKLFKVNELPSLGFFGDGSRLSAKFLSRDLLKYKVDIGVPDIGFNRWVRKDEWR